MTDQEMIVEMKHIDMRFQGVHALDDVSFTLRKGEIHALVGENGAGKSTLMKILVGLYRPNSGEIFYKGKAAGFRSVRDTHEAGICMIFQEFNLVKHLSVAENIHLGREPRTKTGFVDKNKMVKNARAVLNLMGVDINPLTYVRDLTVARQQLVEIAKAISMDADVIIMDEPTSALGGTEIDCLFRLVRSLRDAGKAIVFISHKLEEIYGVCDRVTILRDGRFIHSSLVSEIPEAELIRMMVDRDIREMYPKEPSTPGEIILEVQGLSRQGEFSDINFKLRRGEIFGIAGLMGAGRTEIAETIMGIRQPDAGKVFFKGQAVKNRRPGDAIRRGLIMVPEDRKKNGLVLKLSVRDNLLMSSLKRVSTGGFMRRGLENAHVGKYMKKLEIKAETPRKICAQLSGGNQQKVVMGRALGAEPEVIILDEPTRGIDIKTKSDIHSLMSKLAVQGKAVLMISSEMEEILGMSDRVLVLHEGEQMATLSRAEAEATTIMQYAIGNTKTKEGGDARQGEK